MLIDFYIANVELGSNYVLQPNLSTLLNILANMHPKNGTFYFLNRLNEKKNRSI